MSWNITASTNPHHFSFSKLPKSRGCHMTASNDKCKNFILLHPWKFIPTAIRHLLPHTPELVQNLIALWITECTVFLNLLGARLLFTFSWWRFQSTIHAAVHSFSSYRVHFAASSNCQINFLFQSWTVRGPGLFRTSTKGQHEVRDNLHH